MPTARAALAMAVHRALPVTFARIHPRYLTPTVATLAMGFVSAVFFVLLTLASKNVLADSASSVGLLIAFYYGLTGFACVWFFRRELVASPRSLSFKGILPAAGGLALLAAFALSIKSYWPASSSYSSFAGVGGIFLIGAGSLLIGVLLMLVARWRLPAFFTGRTLPPVQQQAPDSDADGRATGGGTLRSGRRPELANGRTWHDPGRNGRPARHSPRGAAQSEGPRGGGPRHRRARSRRHPVRRRGSGERRPDQHTAVLLWSPRGSPRRCVPARLRYRDRGAGGRTGGAGRPRDQLRCIATRALAGYWTETDQSGKLWIKSWHFGIRDAEVRADTLRDYAAWRRLIADVVRAGIYCGRFSTQNTPGRIAVLILALLDGVGIPFALGDPEITPDGVTADVMSALAEVLRPQAA
ncbi:MAG TPA: TetR family transcriptional regulator C-terminal domain-containing protein [Streptosporangiaceae bacterium]|nr:TetR family transcriptional regulator C-terminal domain-containing protein [Streptosporangiaceae bacterium]